jgi:hypothetical protein
VFSAKSTSGSVERTFGCWSYVNPPVCRSHVSIATAAPYGLRARPTIASAFS